MKYKRICVIVLDSVGIGALPDAGAFGDAGCHTLKHIAEQVPSMRLPNLAAWGLGNIAPIPGIEPASAPLALYGKMAEISAGKDTLTGHWELMGLKAEQPLQVFPEGFPASFVSRFEQATGRAVIGNIAASGTEIIERFGAEHMQSGAWIVYTSADSVLQIAAHEDIVPQDELYKACRIARSMSLQSPYALGRVIARPFAGEPGQFRRTSGRHDYALAPPASTVLNHLHDGGFNVIAVGKINDIFCGEGITESYPTPNNEFGIRLTLDMLKRPFNGLLLVNLVDFDSLYGHRRDPAGYASCLEQFDQALPLLSEMVGEDDLLIVTADHGNDPTHSGTDHTREYVPILIYNSKLSQQGDKAGSLRSPDGTIEAAKRSIGVRSTFADLAATLADNFGVTAPTHGESFLPLLEDEHV